MSHKFTNFNDRRRSGASSNENGFNTRYDDGDDRDDRDGLRRVSHNASFKQKRRSFPGNMNRSYEDERSNGAPYENGRNFSFREQGNSSQYGHDRERRDWDRRDRDRWDGDRQNEDRRDRGQNSRFPRQFPRHDEYSWHRITILSGSNYEKEYVIEQLQKYLAPNSFVPIFCKVERDDLEFYVDNAEDMKNIFSCNRKILMPDNQKLVIRTKPHYPRIPLNEEIKLKMRSALNKRYLSSNNALDLSRFHHDPDFVSDYFCALSKPEYMEAVLEMVAERLPNLSALSLSSNRLGSLESLSILKSKFKHLKVLHLTDNKVQSFSALDSIKEMKLEELNIDKTPLAEKFRNRRADYVSEVRRRFPKILRLDNKELPKRISFDLEIGDDEIPEGKALYAPNEDSKKVATTFFSEYFKVFDSENRDALFNAYHKDACFSLTIGYLPNSSSCYITEHRNLFRIEDQQKRRRLLKSDNFSVIAFLNGLPPTQHLLETLTMDVCVVTDKMMLVTTSGIFRELNTVKSLRFFNRTFMIVPQGSGFSICNEQLHIDDVTENQEKLCQTIMEAVSPPPSATVNESPMESTSLSETQKKQLLDALSHTTKMNLKFSTKCLEDYDWNFNEALRGFDDYKSRGLIPPEAFT